MGHRIHSGTIGVTLGLCFALVWNVEAQTSVSSARVDFPFRLKRDFHQLANAVESFRKDYGRYPETLLEACERPGTEGMGSPDPAEWSYSTDASRQTYTLQHKEYKELRRVNPADAAARKAAIASPCEFLREQVVSGLSGSGDDLKLLIHILRSDPSPGIRGQAALQIARTCNLAQAKPLMLEALLDPDEQVWSYVARQIWPLDGGSVYDEIAGWADANDPRKRLQCARVLSHRRKDGERAWFSLARLLGDPDRQVRISAAISLTWVFQEPVPQAIREKLSVGMKNKDPQFRRACARAAGGCDMPEAVPVLAESLKQAATIKDTWPNFHALRSVNSEEATEVLRSFLTHKDPRVRGDVVSVLGRRPYAERLADMSSCLDDADPDVKVQALEGLRSRLSSPDRSVIPRLVDLLKDQNAEVRAMAASAFWEDSPCGHPHHMYASSLGKLKDPRAIEPLVRLLKDDPNDRVRYAAVVALSLYQDPTTSEALLAALTDTARWRHYPTVATYAAYALQEMKVPVPAEKVRDALLLSESSSLAYLGPLAQACRNQEDLQRLVREAIPKRLESKNEWELVGALTALQLYPLPGVEKKVLELTHHPSQYVRSVAGGLQKRP